MNPSSNNYDFKFFSANLSKLIWPKVRIYLFVGILSLIGTILFLTSYIALGYKASNFYDISKIGLILLSLISSLVFYSEIKKQILDIFQSQYLESQNKIEDIIKKRTCELTRKNSELESINTKVVAAAQLKGEFIANMSHEIRTPMNAIIGMTNLCLECNLSLEQKEYLNTIQNSAESLLNIINDILDFSKIEAGKLPIANVSFDLKSILKDVESLLSPMIQNKNISLIVEYEATTPHLIKGDPLRLKQVLINLLSNAIKFTPMLGCIVLMVNVSHQVGDNVTIGFSVHDTGVGIPLEKQKVIFESFQQAEDITAQSYGGTGLGLTISSQLVKLMGGQMNVTSRPGLGSVFFFSLPFVISNKQEIEFERARLEGDKKISILNDLEPRKILLVEDNIVNQKLALKMIEKLGHNVTIANTGADAIEQLVNNNSFDLIFMDIQMPVMGGFEATKKIRQLPGKLSEIPIVAMTAHAMQGDREKCLESGMNDYISKPISATELKATLKRWG